MKRFFKREFIIGVLVIISVLVLIFGIDYLKGVNIFRPSNYYYVSYTNVTGLSNSAPVTLNGFKVGQVRDMEYDYEHPGNVLVELSLDRRLRVPRGSEALLATDLLGTATIELKLAPSTDVHDIGDRLIGLQKTSLMDGLSTDVLPAVGNLMPKVDSLLTAVTALAGNPAIPASLDHLEVTLANLERTTTVLQRAMQPTPTLVADATASMAEIKTIAANLSTISSDLTQLTAKLKDAPVDSTISHLNTLSANLAAVSERLQSSESSLGLLINDPSLYNNINTAVAHIDSILVDLKRRPKHYIPPIKVF